MSKNRLLQIVNRLKLNPKDKKDLVNIIDTEENGGENPSNQELYAYPVDTLDGKENKVIGLGSDAMYQYVGELVASENGPTEGELTTEVFHTDYYYQPIYDGKYFDTFTSNIQDKYITLYIGNDIDGYSSNKVYISEDANNLTYYDFTFVGGFGPRSLKVAISPDYMLHYRNYWHYTNKNSKVFIALCKQQLDINLIPQEIPRKEDIVTETRKAIIDYDRTICYASFDNYRTGYYVEGIHIYLGELGSKILLIDNYIQGISVSFQLEKEDDNEFYYSSDVADISINKKTKVLRPDVPHLLVHSYSLSPKKLIAVVKYNEWDQTFDFSNVNRTLSNYASSIDLCKGIRLYFIMGEDKFTNIIDSAYCFYSNGGSRTSFYCVYLRNKYLEFKYTGTEEVVENRLYRYYSLTITKEIDISSLESRLAALEAKV